MHVEDEKEANVSQDMLTKRKIFMTIANTFLTNLSIIYTGDDYKNDC
ncbi:MAG: hypothetical protein Ta2E_13360 [Mycoplasmoidaceae bacterium]|nr:MAG: hypothetical protein Ta2E_13360 [Mycoplasmoidaceae bacterium]